MTYAAQPLLARHLKRLRNRRTPRGHIDACAGNVISGWAFAADQQVVVEASVAGKIVASTVPTKDRHDVGRSFPNAPSAVRSGFMLEIPVDVIPADDIVNVAVAVRSRSLMGQSCELAQIVFADPGLVETLSRAPAAGLVGPFPRPVIDTIAAAWPDSCRDLDSIEGQTRFVERLIQILRTPDLRTVPAIADYARYLKAIWAHFHFVENYFPSRNAKAATDAADFHCKPNSVFEMLSIAHQLYVLKSYGIDGDFGEFGCFKGFSSSMLSYACSLLGIHMHIFDSFEGLPPAEGSSYAAGEYAGSLEEVQDHVRRFGVIADVEFHKGFFSDTFKTYRPDKLICLWMDVDLELSSRDLMLVADRLDPRSTLFSHECTPDIFQNGEIVTATNPDNPIPPMLDRFEELGQPLTGRFIRGNTGAFWARSGGIAAMDHHLLVDLVEALP